MVLKELNKNLFSCFHKSNHMDHYIMSKQLFSSLYNSLFQVSSLPNSDVQVNSSITVSLTDGPEVKSVGFNFPFNLTIDSSSFFGLQRKDDLARYLMVCIFGFDHL